MADDPKITDLSMTISDGIKSSPHKVADLNTTNDFSLKMKELELREREVNIKESEHKRSLWLNPALMALFAAAIGLMGNAVVAALNGYYGRILETQKAEYARILEMIKVGNPDSAAENLRMLIDTGLYSDSDGRLLKYLKERQPGKGGYLPLPASVMGSPDSSKFLSDAKVALVNILKRLNLEFSLDLVENPGLANVIAFNDSTGRRIISYDPALIKFVNEKSGTNWSSIAVITHEIGHHALGHVNATRDITKKARDYELEADLFSGYAMGVLGATREEAISAVRVINNVEGDSNYPSRSERVDAVTKGWEKSKLNVGLGSNPLCFVGNSSSANVYQLPCK